MNIDKIHQEYQDLARGRGYWFEPQWKVLQITGKDRVKFLHNLLSQHVEEQAVGERRWSTFLNSKGKLIGFFQVWKLAERFLLIIHESQTQEVYKALEMYWITEDLEMKWLDEVQVVSTFVPSKEKLMEGYAYETNKIVEENILRCSVDDFFIPSVQMILWPEQKQMFPRMASEISKDLFESIRIQSGFPLPQKDFEDPIPLEIPFMHRAVSFVKGCYVGQETIARLHARGLNVSKKLLRFSCKHQVNAQDIVMSDGSEVGKVTSVASSPTENQTIGMAWIHRNAFNKDILVNGEKIEVKYE